MYALDVIKKTALAKKLGGPPIFHDGLLCEIRLKPNHMVMIIDILSASNPLLKNDTRVSLNMRNIKSYRLESDSVGKYLTVIHDLDIRKQDGLLRLLLETTQGDINEVLFESIELTDSPT